VLLVMAAVKALVFRGVLQEEEELEYAAQGPTS
jgi:hypothetical protein